MKEIKALSIKVDSMTSFKSQATTTKNTKSLIESSKLVRFKPKPKFITPCELYEYNNHHSDGCYRVLHCKVCNGTYHRTSKHHG